MIDLPNGLHIRRSLFEDRKLSWTQKVVFALLQHVGSTKKAEDPWPSYRQMADCLGMSEPPIVAAIKMLETWSYLKRTRHGTKPCSYELVYAAI